MGGHLGRNDVQAVSEEQLGLGHPLHGAHTPPTTDLRVPVAVLALRLHSTSFKLFKTWKLQMLT